MYSRIDVQQQHTSFATSDRDLLHNRRVTSTFDLLTSFSQHDTRLPWITSVPTLVFIAFRARAHVCRQTDRQTDKQSVTDTTDHLPYASAGKITITGRRRPYTGEVQTDRMRTLKETWGSGKFCSIFWYRLTLVVPDNDQRAVKWL